MQNTDYIDQLNKIMPSRRVTRLWAKLLLILMLLTLSLVVGNLLLVKRDPVDVKSPVVNETLSSHKREWFVHKLQEIEGLRHQVKTAKTALASIEEQRKSTWISRESDREIYNKTLEYLLSTESKLTTALAEFNTALASANPADIAGLSTQTMTD